MSDTVTIEQLAAGERRDRLSEWVEINQAMIDQFAQATGDHQFIHIDPEGAAQTPFGGTIAHGFLTLSLLPMLYSKTDIPPIPGVRMGVNYGTNRVRFITPVRSGKRVRARFDMLELTQKRPGQWQQTFEVSVEIEDEEKPAMIAEWIFQLFV